MTATASVLDLVESARHRAALAGVLGRLLAEEPGPALADLVTGVPDLAPLAATGLAATFERLLIREAPPYESVFTSADGQRGGPTVAAIKDFSERHDLPPPPRWRVAGADHLGLELWAYGALCAAEGAGWEDDRPDRATRAVEAERELLASHLGAWAEVAMTALARRAAGTPYAALAAAVREFVAGEAERLRPAPDHPGLPLVEVSRAPRHAGPARLARWLLAPGSSGVYFDVDDLATAAGRIGIPWRPSDPRSRLREVVQGATDGGDLSALMAALRPTIAEWRDAHAVNEAERAGNRRAWRAWRMRAEESLRLLDRVDHAGIAPSAASRAGDEPDAVVVRVRGADAAARADAAAAVIGRLRALDLRIAVFAELPPALSRGTDRLLAAGADEVLLASDRSTAVMWRDAGTRAERQQRHVHDADVIVRLEPAAAETDVEVAAQGDRELRARVLDALGEAGTCLGAGSTRTTS